MSNDQSLLQEARGCLKNETDLIIKCDKAKEIATSRILFAILLQPEIKKELLSNENSYILLTDFSLDDLNQLIENVYQSDGFVHETFVQKFPFVNWKLFISMVCIENKENVSETNSATHIEEDSSVECPICGKILSDKKNLKKHADVVHLGIRKQHCTACGKRFSSRNDLLDHVRAVHEKVKAFICDICGQALSARHGLRMHKLIHKDESKAIACSRCDKRFRHRSTYRKHIARVHDFAPEQRLKCEGCTKLFNHMEGLKRHVKKFHSGQKPQFQCDLCPLAFIFNYDLNKHKKRVHLKMKNQ